MNPRPIWIIALSSTDACAAVLAHHGNAELHPFGAVGPGTLLAGLERLRATHSVMTAAQFDSLRGHPAFELADLDALRTVYIVGGVPSAASTSPSFDIHLLDDAAPGVMPLPDASAIAREVEQCLAGTDYAAGVRATQALSRAALHSMIDGLRRSGAFQDASARLPADDILRCIRAASRNRPLLRRWLDVLTGEGLLIREGDGYRMVIHDDRPPPPPDWDHVERLWLRAGDTASTIDFAREAAVRIPELITGSVQAVHLLFPQGRLDLALALYRESIAARYQHRAMAACANAIARGYPGRCLRVLEVGGGTAATTDHVLPALANIDVDYLFTDISILFGQQARARHPGLRTGVYDIDRPPGEQGHDPASFDLIVAGGVLNAARDTDASLRWLTGLLSPGGWLVLSEPTVEEYWVMASQAFMLAEADDDRAKSGSTFLSHRQWRDALQGAALTPVVDLPDPGHPLAALGHRIFAAQASSNEVPYHGR